MKKTLLIIATVFVVVILICMVNPNTTPTTTPTKIPTATITDAASFKYNDAWYWVVQFDTHTTRQDLIDYVRRWSNPSSTSWFFAYTDGLDLSMFSSKNLTFPVFANTIVHGDPKPAYGFYKTQYDDTIHDDAAWVLELAIQ